MTEWIEPDGTPTAPGLHHHYAIWDHEGGKWDPCVIDPEQALAARIEERVAAYASDTKAMEPNEWIEIAAVLAIVREEAARVPYEYGAAGRGLNPALVREKAAAPRPPSRPNPSRKQK